LRSSGPHSNGFSLIRRILAAYPDAPRGEIDGRPLIEHLLAPTRIYVRTVLALLETVRVKGVAHVTGGGLTENVPRVLPRGLGAELDTRKWPALPVFDWIAAAGVAPHEMHRTFNCGIGLTLIVANDDRDAALAALAALGEQAFAIGTVVPDAEQLVTIV
jgi:phosphoribosylformylglycinamidine cyclo-ligase